MARDPRFDVLFEPVPIGPVTARNRFFQVPHCNGMGHRDPSALAAMRGVKAEGGWAVVSTEEVEIHPSSETSPHVEGRLWDEADVPAHRLVVDAIHRHGSLAAVELTKQHPEIQYAYSTVGGARLHLTWVVLSALIDVVVADQTVESPWAGLASRPAPRFSSRTSMSARTRSPYSVSCAWKKSGCLKNCWQ